MVTCHSSFPAPDAFQTAELRSMRAGPQWRRRDHDEGDGDDEGDDDGDDGDDDDGDGDDDDDGDDGDEGGDDDGGGGGDDNDDDTNDDDSTPSLPLAASDRPPQPSRAGFQPSVQLGDISSFDLVDGEHLFFLLEKRTGNSSSKQHPPVTLLLDT